MRLSTLGWLGIAATAFVTELVIGAGFVPALVLPCAAAGAVGGIVVAEISRSRRSAHGAGAGIARAADLLAIVATTAIVARMAMQLLYERQAQAPVFNRLAAPLLGPFDAQLPADGSLWTLNTEGALQFAASVERLQLGPFVALAAAALVTLLRVGASATRIWAALSSIAAIVAVKYALGVARVCEMHNLLGSRGTDRNLLFVDPIELAAWLLLAGLVIGRLENAGRS